MLKQAVTAAALLAALNTAAEIVIDGQLMLQLQPNVVRRIDVPAPAGSSAAEPAAAGKEGAVGDMLTFINADVLHGQAVSVSGEHGLVWSHPDVEQTIAFKLTNLSKLKYADGPKPDVQPAVEQKFDRIQLTNGDELPGAIVTLDNENLVLRTRYGGDLRIRRTMIDCLRPGSKSGAAIYEGPGEDDWENNRSHGKGWSFRNGAYYANGSSGVIGKNFELPDLSNIEFDLQWKGHPNLYVYFYTDNPQNPGGNSYQFRVSGDYLTLQRYSANMGSRDMGNFNMNQLTARGKAHFSLRTDKEEKKIALFIDGSLAKQWEDNAEFAGKGKGVLFYASGGFIKLSGIRITHWDGRFESEAKTAKDEEEDVVVFVNNDKVTGKILTVADEKMQMQTAYAPLEIPVERITLIQFGKKNQERARRNRGDIRSYFKETDGFVTVQLHDIKEGKLTGSTENFGEADFDISTFRSVEFNIYDERKEAGDDNDNW